MTRTTRPAAGPRLITLLCPLILWGGGCARVIYGPGPEGDGTLLWTYQGNVTPAQREAFNAAINDDPNLTGIPEPLKLADGWFRLASRGHRCSITADAFIECVRPSSEPSEWSMLEVNMGGNPAADWLDNHRSSVIGRSYRYDFELRLPPDFLSNKMGGRFTSLGQIPDVPERGGRTPPLILRVVSGVWRLFISGDDRPSTVGLTSQRSESFDLGSVEDVDRWTRWTIEATWAFDDRGALTIARDGVIVHSETGMRNCFNDAGGERGPVFSFGVGVTDRDASEADEVRYSFRNLKVFELDSE